MLQSRIVTKIFSLVSVMLQSRKIQENGWKPRWFRRESEDSSFHYAGGYWEAREMGKWNECPDIFGKFSDAAVSSNKVS